MKSPTIIYPEKLNKMDKKNHVFYTLTPVIDRFMVTGIYKGIINIKPMFNTSKKNLELILKGCFEEEANVVEEMMKLYGKGEIRGVETVIDGKTIRIEKEKSIVVVV